MANDDAVAEEDASPQPTILTVYDPPAPNLPWLAVVIFPDGSVQAASADTAFDAKTIVAAIAQELGIPREGE